MLTINIKLSPDWIFGAASLPTLKMKMLWYELQHVSWLEPQFQFHFDSFLYLPSSDSTSTSTADNSRPCYFINCSWCLLTCCLLLKSLPLKCPYPISIFTWWVSDHPSSVNLCFIYASFYANYSFACQGPPWSVKCSGRDLIFLCIPGLSSLPGNNRLFK